MAPTLSAPTTTAAARPAATTKATAGIAARAAHADGHAAQHDGLGLLAAGRLEAGDDLAGDAALDQLLDVAQEDVFIDADQADRLALCAGTAGAAGAVHIDRKSVV